jgi:hypothetical protein
MDAYSPSSPPTSPLYDSSIGLHDNDSSPNHDEEEDASERGDSTADKAESTSTADREESTVDKAEYTADNEDPSHQDNERQYTTRQDNERQYTTRQDNERQYNPCQYNEDTPRQGNDDCQYTEDAPRQDNYRRNNQRGNRRGNDNRHGDPPPRQQRRPQNNVRNHRRVDKRGLQRQVEYYLRRDEHSVSEGRLRERFPTLCLPRDLHNCPNVQMVQDAQAGRRRWEYVTNRR